ncbi:MAG: tetratricopeptide repeat protein [Deltaproteobacteria bacterium]|nr:tetratricopeptide repeat protein [Deltaproteobacteria bacterium]
MLNIAMESEDVRMLMEAGYLLLAMRRFKESEEVFEGIQVLVSNSEVPIVAQGNVHCVQGHFDQAIKIYQQALKLVPESAFAKAYLAEALLFKGDVERSKSLLEESMAADKNGKTGDFARALLDLIKKGFRPAEEAKPSSKS